MSYRKFIIEILESASRIANRHFGKASGVRKGKDKNQILTKADLEIGKYIARSIKNSFPTHNIIDEEAGVIDHKSEYTWVVDPIDGTSNFASGVPTYGIMIGLLYHGTPIAGGIALPYFKSIAIAEKGKGTLLNGKRIKASKEGRLINVLIAYHIDGHTENPRLTHQESKIIARIVLEARNIRSSSSAFDIVMVAKGG